MRVGSPEIGDREIAANHLRSWFRAFSLTQARRNNRPGSPSLSHIANIARSLRGLVRWKIELVLLPLLAFQLLCRAQDEHSGAQLPRVIDQVWTSQEGAPDNIIALAQTADGFLWLGGMTGLFRFDGVHFERFQPADGNHLQSNAVYSLFAPATGGLWVGYTFGGSSFIQNGHVQNYGGENAAQMGSTTGFAQDGSGPLWANTSTGMWQFDGTKWEHLGAAWKAPTHIFGEMWFDRHGVLWILDQPSREFYRAKTLICLKPGAKAFEVVDDQLSDRFTLDADGKVITAPGLPRPTSRRIEGIAEYPVLRRGDTQFLDRFGGLWLFQDSRLMPMRRTTAPAAFNHQQAEVKLPQVESFPSVVDAFKWLNDREGNLWISTTSALHKLSFSSLRLQPTGDVHIYYPTLAASDRGGVWIGSTTADNETLFCELSGGEPRRCLPLKTRAPVTAAYSARDGALWIANDDGIWRYEHNKLQSVDRPAGLKSGHYVQGFAENSQGGMWISFGRLGLYRYAAGVWTRNGGYSELPALTLTEYTDRSGFVWFGCINNDLGVLEGDHVRVFAAKDGMHVGNVTAITGRGSEIWIGGERGIQWVQDGHIHDVFAVNRGWLEGISGIVATSDGDLWLNGLSGITHISSREVAAAMADPAHKMTGQHYGEIEGAPGAANQVRPLETAVQSTDGRIWFSGSKGYRWIDPRTAVQIAAPPPVSITSLVADRKSYELGHALVLPAGTSDVRISFAGISLSDPAAIRFRYKLQETNDAWHESDTATPVTYQNLSPGTYHFSANSSDSTGAWTENIARQVFTILSSWYQTGYGHYSVDGRYTWSPRSQATHAY